MVLVNRRFAEAWLAFLVLMAVVVLVVSLVVGIVQGGWETRVIFAVIGVVCVLTVAAGSVTDREDGSDG